MMIAFAVALAFFAGAVIGDNAARRVYDPIVSGLLQKLKTHTEQLREIGRLDPHLETCAQRTQVRHAPAE